MSLVWCGHPDALQGRRGIPSAGRPVDTWCMRIRSVTPWLAMLAAAFCLAGCTPSSHPVAPIAAATATPATGTAPLDVTLSGSASSGSELVAWTWTIEGAGSTASKSGTSIDHRFEGSGTYEVRLRITDACGRSDEAVITVTVENRPPLASCRFSTDAPLVNQPVSFDASGSIDFDGTVTEIHWDFGDGTTGRGSAVSHTYREEGRYTVRLTVVDNAGASDTAEHTMTVHTTTGGGGCGGGGGVCF